ncbi:MAG TPA: FG-GAP-like repeat-containing protein [Rhodanobacteraceae bacterium]|nr:FG-GAP-like repeat-containing protein [Rhodanobacteraceae bacterium]
MQTRLLIASAALTAVVGLSASIAVSLANSHSDSPKAAAISSTDAGHPAAAPAGTGAAHAGQRIALAAAHANAGRAQSAALAPSTLSSSTPTLITVQGGAHELARGAQKAVPVAVNEEHAMQAIFKGGMWLPNATGGREYAKYDHHLIHDNGDWTWVGKVQTDHGMQSAVITFGKDAVFGLIPQASGNALRLVTADGQELLVQTDGAKMAASALSRQLYARQDFKVPSRKAESSAKRAASASARTSSASAQQVTSAATTSSGPTIDVMVAYTPGIVSAYGTTSAALTRINNLVDITNQAYSDSGVSQRIRLVYTMQVSYTDTNDNTQALDDLTGNDGKGNSVPIPSSLQGVANARAQYGADLVVLLRHFNDAGNSGCGVGWLIGAGQQQIIPSEDNAFGYSVVQDGQDGGYYCLDTTFAHELGHNMGSAHDRAHADQPGAYSYSYGYVGNGTDGFATIMAYGSDTQTPVNYFSNPDIAKCQNTACGVADTSTSSADNVHSLNNTASLIAQFEPTKVATDAGVPPGQAIAADVNGDGKTDLLWRQTVSAKFAYWLMNGPVVALHSPTASVNSSFSLVGAGDFFGNGGPDDLVWTNDDSIWMWVGGANGFGYQRVGSRPSGWNIIGVADINGDHKADLIWRNSTSGKIAYWLMSGAVPTLKSPTLAISQDYHVAAIGDFDGDGKADLVVTNGLQIILLHSTDTGFVQQPISSQPGSDWQIVGAGDVDGDGKADLLWRNTSTGSLAYWLMNGSTVLKASPAFAAPKSFSISAIGDFNGDGKADIVWSNGSILSMWIGNGSGFSIANFSSQPVGWKTIAPPAGN